MLPVNVSDTLIAYQNEWVNNEWVNPRAMPWG
jgi:hypothetical protein